MAVAETEIVAHTELLDVNQMARFVTLVHRVRRLGTRRIERSHPCRRTGVGRTGQPHPRSALAHHGQPARLLRAFRGRARRAQPAAREGRAAEPPRPRARGQPLGAALHRTSQGHGPDVARGRRRTAPGATAGRASWSFDILTAYFAHDTPHEMGPTLVLPGSHMRSVLGPDAARYKNIAGQKRLSGKAGTDRGHARGAVALRADQRDRSVAVHVQDSLQPAGPAARPLQHRRMG